MTDTHLTGDQPLCALREQLKRRDMYIDSDTTGNHPPEDCWAPTKSERGGPPLREQLKRRDMYIDSDTTGNRPPEDCWAPEKRRQPAGNPQV